MIKCIIIDDQKDAIELLVDHVKNRSELILLKSFTNPIDGLSFLKKNSTDLVFLDIQMPHLNGLEFIESLRSKLGNSLPDFILTTGFDEYALSGFEHGVSDYLVKPIEYKRFIIAVDRYISKQLKNENAENEKMTYFFADVNGKKEKINFRDIAYIESQGNYVSIVGDNNLKMLIYKSMHSMQEMLSNNNFIRVHKSFIV